MAITCSSLFLQKFLLLEEKDQTSNLLNSFEKTINCDTKLNDEDSIKNNSFITRDIAHLNDFGVEISNATAKWTDDQTKNSLENINLTVKSGQLAAIVGPVGSGKVCILIHNN